MSKLLIVVVVILICVIVIIGIFFILNLRHEKGEDSIVMFKDFEKSKVL
jgi:signal transduction histidine kinase